jgi:cyclic-di-GMP-binding protein
MPSFDIVSEVNSMEIENAVNMATKELANRFDFKGTRAEIKLEQTEIKLSAEDEFKIRALKDIVIAKLAKRGIDLKSVEKCDPDISPLGHARQTIRIKQGIATDVGKQISGLIRELKLKVTAQIQDQQVRVQAKSRDDLQKVMAAVKAADLSVAVQFKNLRD